MAFFTEPTGYEKTVISDLQGSWINLRDTVVDNLGFPDSNRLLFHIDEAMSWESVRNLNIMKTTFVLIQNIATQANVPEEVMECIAEVRENLDEVEIAIVEGSAH